MQSHVFEHFSSNDHNGFSEDYSIIVTVKTDGSDSTRRDEYWRKVLKAVTPHVLNMIDWLFHLGKIFKLLQDFMYFLREGCLHR